MSKAPRPSFASLIPTAPAPALGAGAAPSGTAVAPLPQPPADLQSQQFGINAKEIQARRTIIERDILGDMSEAERMARAGAISLRLTEIADSWSKATHHFLVSGNGLLQLAREVPEATLDRILNHFETCQDGESSILPFSRSTASRLMIVATMVEKRRFHVAFEQNGLKFDEKLLPPYSIAAAYNPLDEDQLAHAVKLDLIRPNVTRTAVVDFVQKVTKTTKPAAQNGANIDLRRKLSALNKKIAKLLPLLAEAHKERAEIEAKLGMPRSELPDPVSGAVAAQSPVSKGEGGQSHPTGET